MSNNQEEFRLSSITKKTKKQIVTVRILRLWIQKERKGMEGFEMILMDEWGNKIQASISPRVKNNFMPLIENGLIKEGKIAVLKNFQILENKSNLQNAVLKHDWKLSFGLATKVSPSVEGVRIDEHGFQFIPFKDFPNHDMKIMLDVLGEVTTKNIIIETKGNSTMCDIQLVDADGKDIKCALWGSFADELKAFMDNKASNDNEPVIMALQFAMMTTFNGKRKITAMKNASRFFIRPDIQEVKDFILRRGVGGAQSSTAISDHSSGIRELKSEEWLNVASARTIKEMKSSKEMGKYICKGTIKDFHAEEPWYYEACGNGKCYKSVPKGSKIGDYCKKCNGPIESIVIRYFMKVLVEDETEQEYFTFFEDCTLYFLKKAATQIMKEMEAETGDRNGTPKIFYTMLERECLFKVDVGEKNDGSRVYTVKNVTEDVDLMSQFTSNSSVSEDNSKCTESFILNEENRTPPSEEICSNSESTNTTPQKRSRNDDDRDMDDGDEYQLSSTKQLKK